MCWYLVFRISFSFIFLLPYLFCFYSNSYLFEWIFITSQYPCLNRTLLLFFPNVKSMDWITLGHFINDNGRIVNWILWTSLTIIPPPPVQEEVPLSLSSKLMNALKGVCLMRLVDVLYLASLPLLSSLDRWNEVAISRCVDKETIITRSCSQAAVGAVGCVYM